MKRCNIILAVHYWSIFRRNPPVFPYTVMIIVLINMLILHWLTVHFKLSCNHITAMGGKKGIQEGRPVASRFSVNWESGDHGKLWKTVKRSKTDPCIKSRHGSLFVEYSFHNAIPGATWKYIGIKKHFHFRIVSWNLSANNFSGTRFQGYRK